MVGAGAVKSSGCLLVGYRENIGGVVEEMHPGLQTVFRLPCNDSSMTEIISQTLGQSWHAEIILYTVSSPVQSYLGDKHNHERLYFCLSVESR